MFVVLLKGLDEVGTDVEVGEVLDSLLEDRALAPQRVVQARFSRLDIDYLVNRTGVKPKVVASMLRTFGEAVVLESLRRFASGWQYAPRSKEALFVSICRAVESVAISAGVGVEAGQGDGALAVATAADEPKRPAPATSEAGGELTSAAPASSGGPQSPPASSLGET